MMQPGQFKLYWTNPEGQPRMWICDCFDEALEEAALVFGNGGTITQIENWFGSPAAPTDQVIQVAEMRYRDQQRRHKHKTDETSMKSQPLWNAF